MADVGYREENIVAAPRRTDWGAIWAGVFVFVGIWSVFGLLGMAIFASASKPALTNATTGVNVGMAIWAIVLTIIAMYAGGRETGRLAATDRREGVVHGMVMFGLSVVAALVIAVLGGRAASAATSNGTYSPYLLTVFSGLGWTGFLSLFLGWLAAMGGASSGAQSGTRRLETRQPIQSEDVRRMRPAA